MLSFKGFGSDTLTFTGPEDITAGTVVKVIGNAEVSACADGDAFFGVADINRNGIICVQAGGYIEAPYTGDAPEHGYVSLCADGKGGVKAGTGRTVTVVMVDEAAGVCGFIL